MTHTPGPWTYDADANVIWAMHPDLGRIIIARPAFVAAEAQANAVMIAALPNLHAALLELHAAADEALSFLDAKRERGDFDHWQSFSLGDLGMAIHTAREALAKALPASAGADVKDDGVKT